MSSSDQSPLPLLPAAPPGTLNVMCAICFEFYKKTDVVYSTTCGHLFHKQCLYASLSHKNSCPQCRRPCQRAMTHRVFLNYGESTIVDGKDVDQSELMMNTPVWIMLDDPEQNYADGIKTGTDPDGNDTYVARAYYDDDLLPAGYCPQKGFAYASYGCHAHTFRNGVEILLNGDYKWVADEDGHVPQEAIVTGYSERGENLYTGRGIYKGITLLGKVHPSHRTLYMPYNGQEVNIKQYEVLVLAPKQKEEQQD